MPKPKAPKRRHTNLLKIFDELNSEYFGGSVCGGIGWRNIPIGEGDHSLAICVFDERFVRVSTVLDDTRIPIWYLRSTIYHEMCHLSLGPYNEDGLIAPHNSRFCALESRHPDNKRADEFSDNKLPKILKHWREWRAYNRARRIRG